MIMCKSLKHQVIAIAFLALFVAGGLRPAQAAPVPLLFNDFSPATNVTDMGNVGLGPGYSLGLVMDFTNVATDGFTTVDARVTATLLNTNTGFGPDYFPGDGNTNAERGFIPDYRSLTTAEPEADFGFLYDAITFGTAGVTFQFDFYDGTGGLSETFINPYSILDLELLVYDVDGESTPTNGANQTEYFDAFFADGLYSYATGNAAASLTATPITGGINFLGPGINFPETDTSGAAILRYQNTDSVTLVFGSNYTSPPDVGSNFVFSAIDGDLSLLDNRDGFNDPVIVAPVPEPATMLLLGTGLVGVAGAARRRKKKHQA